MQPLDNLKVLISRVILPIIIAAFESAKEIHEILLTYCILKLFYGIIWFMV